jgi:hypothetical protein
MGKVIEYKTRKAIVNEPADISESWAVVEHANALECYENWPTPTTIISDGPYGLSKYPGDAKSADTLVEMYAPHVAAWSKYSSPQTTLWFWCSEVGWAEVHSLLKAHGWSYKAAHVWDKGIGHVAGNCNGDSIRGFPVVSEICVQYVREARIKVSEGENLSLKAWLRHEWQRSGLPLNATNEACGVKNAATRKYFTQCHLWYFPPPEKMVALAKYANKFGKKTDQPYFSLDGKSELTEKQWNRLRTKWNHSHGITNVWTEPSVRGEERLRINGLKSLHANQKPLKLMRRLIEASSDKGDVIWEPFGGLCSATVAALELQRIGVASEVIKVFYDAAYNRLRNVEKRIANYPYGHKTRSRA